MSNLAIFENNLLYLKILLDFRMKISYLSSLNIIFKSYSYEKSLYTFFCNDNMELPIL